MAETKSTSNLTPLLVTTSHRGVFFGYARLPGPDLPASIELMDARCCVYWSTDCHGVLGLAAQGPNKTCRVGPKVPALTLWSVTAIAACTAEAAQQWEAEPWKN